jgi:predicted nucleotide-binding protein
MHEKSSETAQTGDLGHDVAQVVRRGATAPRLLDLEDLPHLRRLAGEDLRPPVRAMALTRLLDQAMARLPEGSRTALQILGGMTEESAGAPLGLRRETAAKVLEVAPTTFRTHREPRLIKELTQALYIVSAETHTDQQAASRDDQRVNRVLVVHAANSPAKGPMFDLLRTWGLQPLSIEQMDLLGSKERLNSLATAVERAQAVVVLIDPMMEPRPTEPSKEVQGAIPGNILFELGYLLGIARRQTVIVVHGEISIPTDLAGITALRIDNRPSTRNALRARLEALGCRLDGSLDWLDPAVGGDFELRWDFKLGPDHQLRVDLEGHGYNLDAPLARRAFGETWLAHSLEDKQERLIKVYRDLSDKDRAFVRKWLELASALPSLGEQKIELLIEKEDLIAAVLDPPDGIALDEVGSVPPEEGVRIAIDLLQAVGELHDYGLVHRDISPSNVLLVQGGKPVLADLGIGRRVADFEAEKEHIHPLARAMPQEDVQAIGRLLLFLVRSWRPPIRSSSPEDPPRLHVSHELERVINRSLSQGISCYESADAMRQDLEMVPETEKKDSTKSTETT